METVAIESISSFVSENYAFSFQTPTEVTLLGIVPFFLDRGLFFYFRLRIDSRASVVELGQWLADLDNLERNATGISSINQQ